MPQRLMNTRMWKVSEVVRSHPAWGYALAIGSFAAALAARFVSDPYLPPGFPFLSFFPAVLLTAFFGGTRPGILCAVLSTLAAHYFFIIPAESFTLDPQSIVAILFFVTVISIDLLIIDIMNRSIEQLRHEKRVSHDLLEQQTVMFQELQHRVANNLGFVSNLLSIQKGRVADNVEAQAVLEDARIRLDMMSRVHRRLYDPTNANLTLSEHLRILCSDVVEASGVQYVTCEVEVPAIKVDLEKMLNLSLVVIEAVTNSLKHAFPDGRQGQIRIAMTSYGLSHYILTVQDNGKGFPEGFDPAKGDRLGFKILMGFARSLNGEISFANENGGQIKLVFAA